MSISHTYTDDHGNSVVVHHPTTETLPFTWFDPKATAIFTPGGVAPSNFLGVTMCPWLDHPMTPEGWAKVEGQNPTLADTFDLLEIVPGKQPAVGVIIEEPDGRIWICSPTNGFGGYDNTFPKGSVESGIGLQATAIRVAFEKTGLKIAITGVHGDYERRTSFARMFLAKRIGGTVKNMGWQSQAMSLVPPDKLDSLFNAQIDRVIAGDYRFEVAIGKGSRREIARAQHGLLPFPQKYYDHELMLEDVTTAIKGAFRRHGIDNIYNTLSVCMVVEAISSPLKYQINANPLTKRLGFSGVDTYLYSRLPCCVELLKSPHSVTVNPLMDAIAAALLKHKSPISDDELFRDALRIHLGKPRLTNPVANSKHASLHPAFLSARNYLMLGLVIQHTEDGGSWRLCPGLLH